MCFLLRVSDEPRWLHQYEPFCRLGAGLQSGPLSAEIHGKLSVIIFSSRFIVHMSPAMGSQQATRTAGDSAVSIASLNVESQSALCSPVNSLENTFQRHGCKAEWCCHYVDASRECAQVSPGAKRQQMDTFTEGVGIKTTGQLGLAAAALCSSLISIKTGCLEILFRCRMSQIIFIYYFTVSFCGVISVLLHQGIKPTDSERHAFTNGGRGLTSYRHTTVCSLLFDTGASS